MQDLNKEVLYADPAGDPDAFKSLNYRRSVVDGKLVISAGGTGSSGLTSAWFMALGKRGLSMIYNKGAGFVGLQNIDEGRNRITDDDGNPYWVWERHYKVYGNLFLRQPKALIRYANLVPDAASGADGYFDPKVIVRQIKPLIPYELWNTVVLFVSPYIYGQIEEWLMDKNNIQYGRMEIENYGEVPTIAGIPIRQWDAISENEAAIPAAA
jgi:hypothetical protein